MCDTSGKGTNIRQSSTRWRSGRARGGTFHPSAPWRARATEMMLCITPHTVLFLKMRGDTTFCPNLFLEAGDSPVGWRCYTIPCRSAHRQVLIPGGRCARGRSPAICGCHGTGAACFAAPRLRTSSHEGGIQQYERQYSTLLFFLPSGCLHG